MTNERIKQKGEAYICGKCKKSICVGNEVVFIDWQPFHPDCLKKHIEKTKRKVEESEEF